MKSLDTNIVLRFLLGDMPEQSAVARQMISDAKPNSFAIADAVFFETAWIISGPAFGVDRKTLGALLIQLTDIPQINCNRSLIKKAVPLYVAHPSLSFVDVCLAVYAELNGQLPLLTYDQKLARKLPKTVKLMR